MPTPLPPTPAAAFRWSDQADREWSPAGTIRIYAMTDLRYRAMYCPTPDGPPYFALVGHDGYWGSNQNWEVVSRHQTLDEAKAACEHHAADQARA